MEVPGYKIIETIHSDEEGGNYLATQECSGQQVIVRFLAKKLLPATTAIGSYLEEGESASTFSHPNVAKIHEVGGNDDNVYVVMEYVPGVSLDVKHSEMCLLDKIYVIKQIAKTLDDLHSKGCGHFNLKLSNIIISEYDSRVILVGYELPTKQKQSTGPVKISSSSASCMSPEQIQGKALDIRSDLYSLGSIFYTLLVGAAPYQSNKPEKILDKHLNTAVPRLSKTLSMFQPIIDKAMAKSPGQRFQSGAELIAIIDELDDEEIIEADSPHETSNAANLTEENSEQDNVVVIPTALSLQARKTERSTNKTSRIKGAASENTIEPQKGPFEKLNKKQNDSELKRQKARAKVQEKTTVLKSTFAELSLDGRKTRRSWFGALVFITSIFGAGFFVAQQNDYQLPAIKTFSAEPARGSQGLPGLIASPPVALLQSQGDKVANPQKPETDPISNKTNEPEINLTPSVEQAVNAKMEMTPENSTIESVPSVPLKQSSPQLIKESVVQDAPILHAPADQILPPDVNLDVARQVEQPESINNGTIQEQATKQEDLSIEATALSQKNTMQVSISQAVTDSAVLPDVIKPSTSVDQAEIDRLLHLADMKRSTGNLVYPADNSAISFYRQVLVLDEGNSAALAAMKDIRDVVIEQIIFLMDNGQLVSADALLTRMSIFFKPSQPYGKLVERLHRLKAEANAAQKVETNATLNMH